MFFKIISKLNYHKKFPYYIATPLAYSIGDASEHIALAASHAKNLGKKILIFKTKYFQKFLGYKVCNNALFDFLVLNNQTKEKSFFYFIIDQIIQLEFLFRRSLAIFLKKFFKIDLGENFRFSYLGILELYTYQNTLDYKKIEPFNIKSFVADIQENKKEECYKLLRGVGIKDKRFVCLHVRDNTYHKDVGRKEYRNSNINNYIELINLLISKDYYVLRMGDSPTPKLNFTNKKFIDYPYSDIKSELMDLFLIKECNFFVGTQSGIMDTAHMFKKPLLLTNICELFSSFPRKKNDRGIFKKIIDKKNGKIINIKDFAKLNINYHNPEVEIKDINFEENSDEELYAAMQEYLNLIEEKNQVTDIQINFKKFLQNRLEEIYNENFTSFSSKKINRNFSNNEFLRIIRCFKMCEGNYSTSYLEKNFI